MVVVWCKGHFFGSKWVVPVQKRVPAMATCSVIRGLVLEKPSWSIFKICSVLTTTKPWRATTKEALNRRPPVENEKATCDGKCCRTDSTESLLTGVTLCTMALTPLQLSNEVSDYVKARCPEWYAPVFVDTIPRDHYSRIYTYSPDSWRTEVMQTHDELADFRCVFINTQSIDERGRVVLEFVVG